MIAKNARFGFRTGAALFQEYFPILKFSLTGSRTLAAIRFRDDSEPVAGDFGSTTSGDAYMEADFSESTVEEVCSPAAYNSRPRPRHSTWSNSCSASDLPKATRSISSPTTAA